MINDRFDNEIVSVITPVYNAERFLRETVESALNQTYPQMEIILVDDCSPDKSSEIIKELMATYPNIVYHLQPSNMGAGVARNTALELANGRYVAFLDADDVWKPEKTARQLELMKEKGSPFGYTAIEMIDETGKVVKGKRKVREKINYKFLLHNTMIATSTVIIDRKELGDFRMPLRRGGQDYATWLSLLRSGCTAVGINEALEQYRLVSGSLSSNKLKSVKQIWEIQTKDEKIFPLIVLKNIFLYAVNAVMKYFF